ncbi:MAG TPA: YraN family protein [Terriglobia bacterium]|nr:YraN family protein [Terriglobia bacterium]
MPFPWWPFQRLPFGRRSEIEGAEYLRTLGWKIVASGFRTRDGEIDLIAWEGDQLVFVEVKARRSGAPEDAVGFAKQRRITRAARAYRTRYRLENAAYRFDILAVIAAPGANPRYELLRDAFRENSRGGL